MAIEGEDIREELLASDDELCHRAAVIIDLLRTMNKNLQAKVDELTVEILRRQRAAEINAHPTARQTLEKTHGQVWSTDELSKDFEVLGFAAPYVIVRRRSDGVKGSLEFQHDPRFYFNWTSDES